MGLGQNNTSAGAAQALNVTYSIADFVNKIAGSCWHAGPAPSRTLRQMRCSLCCEAVLQQRADHGLGRSIYPARCFLGQNNTSAGAAQALNVTYSIADFVTKIAGSCWHAGPAPSRILRQMRCSLPEFVACTNLMIWTSLRRLRLFRFSVLNLVFF